MTTKKAYMYVLECVDKTLYTGYTTDLKKRLATHNAGKGLNILATGYLFLYFITKCLIAKRLR